MFSVGDSSVGVTSSSSTGRHGRLRNWIVPRRTMCILFWTGVMLIFTGMILLVTSQHKGKAFQSWGAVLLGLGLCVMLGCLILCLHTYFVMSRIDRGDDDDELTDDKIYRQRREMMYPSTTRTPGTTTTTTPTTTSNTTTTKLPNATMSMTSSNAVAIDMINGRNSTNVNRCSSQFVPTPRCGVSVVANPPPTVRLYVSDVIDRDAPTDGAKSLEPEVTSTPSTDPLSSGDTTSPPTAGSSDIAACAVENGRRRTGYDVTNGSRVRSPTSPPQNGKSRKLSTSGSGTSPTTITTKNPPEPDEGDAWLAQWRQERDRQPQQQQRPTSLPFPPAHITFNAIDHDDDATAEAAAAGGLSSCDSFNQSTETIIARDPAATKNSKAAAAARRKSVYYNAAETLPDDETETDVFLSLGHKSRAKSHRRTNTTSGGGAEGDEQYRRHRTHRHERHRREAEEPDASTVPRRSAASSLVSQHDVASGIRRSRQWTGHPAEDEAGQTFPPSYLSVTAAPGPPTTNPAACRVTRVSLHSDVVRRQHQHQLPVPGPDDNQPPSSAAAAAAIAATSRGAGALPAVRFAGPDTVQLTRPHRPPPTSAAGTTSSLSADVSGLSRGRLATVGGATASTSRTFGPACVTVTPLVPVDECARFPTDRELRDHRRSQQPLDPADLLREEYEASFGGEVNPLLLYSGGSLDNQEVTLSKQTVYDNVQYFNV